MPQVSSGARVDTKVDQQLLRETSKEEFLAHCRRETGGFFANLRSVPDTQRPKRSDLRAKRSLALPWVRSRFCFQTVSCTRMRFSVAQFRR